MALRAVLNVRVKSLRAIVNCVDADVQRVIRLKAKSGMAREADTAVANAVQHLRNIGGALIGAIAQPVAATNGAGDDVPTLMSKVAPRLSASPPNSRRPLNEAT